MQNYMNKTKEDFSPQRRQNLLKSGGAKLYFLVSLVMFAKKWRGKSIPFCTISQKVGGQMPPAPLVPPPLPTNSSSFVQVFNVEKAIKMKRYIISKNDSN